MLVLLSWFDQIEKILLHELLFSGGDTAKRSSTEPTNHRPETFFTSLAFSSSALSLLPGLIGSTVFVLQPFTPTFKKSFTTISDT
jgi:hypothetical protein